MPERWQDELKKLHHEGMPDAVRDRAEAGPRRELPSDGRQRLVAGVVAFAVFIAAGAFAWRAFDGGEVAEPAVDDRPSVIVTLSSDPFAATLTYEDVTQEGIENGSSWDTPNGTIGAGAPYAVVFDSYVRVPAGTPITIQSDATELSLALEAHGGNMPGPARTVALEAGSGTLPSSYGRYEMQVTGRWDRGFATFAFGIQIMPQGADAVVIALNGTTDGPTATLTSEGRTQDGARESYDWCNGDECVGADADSVSYPPVSEYLPAVSGSPFESVGDGELTRLVVRTTEGSFASDNVVQDTDGTGGTVPVKPGRYAVWIAAAWGDRGHATFYFGIEVLPEPADIPEMIHLTCTPERATLDTTVVRVQADGLHIAVDASADVAGADFITGTTPEEFFGIGLDERDDGTRGISISPGEWGVGCYEGARGAVGPSDFGTPRVASFTVVDPDDRYAETDLTCTDPETTEGVTGLPVGSSPTADEVSSALAGLEAGDVVREGGYDNADGFKLGPTYVVQRAGQTIARITLGSAPDDALSSWAVTIAACSGAGIGSASVESPASSAAPDVLRLTCDAEGTRAESTIVRAQADGVHLLVAASGGIDNVIARPAGPDPSVVYSSGSNGIDDEFVQEMDPGPWLVVCGSTDQVDEEHVAESWPPGSVEVSVVATDAIYRSIELACSDADVTQFPPKHDRQLSFDAEFLRDAEIGVRVTDVVERAGYYTRQSSSQWWRVVRDGEVVAAFYLSNAGGGSVPITRACSGSGIGGA